MALLRIATFLVIGIITGCSGSEFSNNAKTQAKQDSKKNTSKSQDPDPTDTDEPTPKDETPTPQKTSTVVTGSDDSLDTIGADQQCILSAKGTTRTSIKISGENCINNGVDPGGADFNDYHVTLTGAFLKSDWEFFATVDQDIKVSYNLGSPGSTTQSVRMQVVDCFGKSLESFDVSSGSGEKTLKSRRGDRFAIVTTITGGCYGRRDIYDLLKDKDKAFKVD